MRLWDVRVGGDSALTLEGQVRPARAGLAKRFDVGVTGCPTVTMW